MQRLRREIGRIPLPDTPWFADWGITDEQATSRNQSKSRAGHQEGE